MERPRTDSLAPQQSHSRPPIDFLDPPQRSDEIGRFGPFRILDVLGHGGMGVVFRAEEIRLERLVAVKVMHAPLQCDSTAKERFTARPRRSPSFETTTS